MRALHMIAFVLVIVGGLNWGLYGAFEYNLVDSLLGQWAMVEKIVYILVGLSALTLAFTHKTDCKTCENKPGQPAM